MHSHPRVRSPLPTPGRRQLPYLRPPPSPGQAARPQPFYAQSLPTQSRKALTEAANLDGLAQEIAVLRTIIRDMAAAGQLEATRRAIEALSRILHAQRTSGEPSDRLAAWLEETLDDLEANPS